MMKIKLMMLVLVMVIVLPLSVSAQNYDVDYDVTYDETYMRAFMPGLEAHFGSYAAIDNMVFVEPGATYTSDMFQVVPVQMHNETDSSVWRKATIYVLIFLGGDYGDGS